MRIFRLGLMLFALLLGVMGARAESELYPDVPWQPLNNGRDLAGWKFAAGNGAARFEWRDSAIVGTTVQGQPITFLQTEQMYGNFLLEFEFMVPAAMNAGLQFRSHGFAEYRNGAFHGYQFELTGFPPSHDARWTGGIFDEVRRGWIGPVVNRSGSENPCRVGEWNEARLLVIGDTIKTWVNDVPIVEMRDSMTPAGYIALQLHDSQKRSGDEIRWRNFRIKDLDRATRVDTQDRFVGAWKGATSNAGLGIYARVEKNGELYVATMFEDPAFRSAPLATLSGRIEGNGLALNGGDWSGRIENDVFRGGGRMRGVRIVHHYTERTSDVVPVRFELMPGTFALERQAGR